MFSFPVVFVVKGIGADRCHAISGSVIAKGIKADGRIVTGVVKCQRSVADGCILRADRIVVERIVPEGRIEACR